jgi:outer membrane protein, heavy metal efflux system
LPNAEAALAPAAPAADNLTAALNTMEGSGRSISLEAALYGTISNNPDLVTLRNSNIASPEAVEVARRFPTTLNPTVWIDYRPITLVPNNTFGTSSSSGSNAAGNQGFYHRGQQYILFSVRQPIELGHQTTHRYNIARAALSQQQWTVVQAELAAMVQTYRFFQTAAYRREKLRVAANLAEFNDKLMHALRRRLEANQVAAADVVLAEVENQATRQQADVARQDYANALADLRNQLGQPEEAGASEPLGEFVLPGNIPQLDENALIQMALKSRPDIHAAHSVAQGALAAVNLARGDRIPTPVVGPQYAMDEAGIQYIGLILVSAIPVLNNGGPLLRQREAEYRRACLTVQQAEKRAVVQVRAAAGKWNAANRLVSQTAGLAGSLRDQVARMERLFDANQADLTKLLQSRQRLIQLENARLDALWQAAQAQSDLLLALGVPNLIAALNAHQPAAAAAAPATTH